MQLRENVVALNPEFAFASATSTTQGPVAQNATTTVFGRQSIGTSSLASETFDGLFFSGNTQAIAIHHFTECEVYPRRTPAAGSGSARQHVNENSLFLPFSCSGDNSTANTAYGDRLEYPGSDEYDVWSSVDGSNSTISYRTTGRTM